MKRLVVLLLITGLTVSAAEPTEVYKRATAATVVISAGQHWIIGVVLSRAEGLVLTHQSIVSTSAQYQVIANKQTVDAQLLADDTELGLALFHVKDLGDLVKGELPLAPALMRNKDAVEKRVYSVSTSSRDRPLRFAQGLTAGIRRVDYGHVMMILHDGHLKGSPYGAPLLDSKARLLGLCVKGGDAIPVNAVRLFMQRHGHKTLGQLPKRALKITVPGDSKTPPRELGTDRPDPAPEQPAFKVPARRDVRLAIFCTLPRRCAHTRADRRTVQAGLCWRL